jgi:uncharacterized membrane protein
MPTTFFRRSVLRSWPLAWLVLIIGVSVQAMFLQSVLVDRTLASQWFSTVTWSDVAGSLGGVVDGESGVVRREVGYLPLFGGLGLVSLLALSIGSLVVSRRTGRGFLVEARGWALRGWAWWLLPGAWELLRVAEVLSGLEWFGELAIRTVSLFEAMTLSGWLCAWLVTFRPLPGGSLESNTTLCRRTWCLAFSAVALYTVCATAINWARYNNLLVPHGDSAMYEEHLWNTWHGKGFRSYLDEGRLFLGEHLQVVHLLLSPFHWIWPSHRMLELCESAGLAAGSLAVLRLARRETRSDGLALALSLAYLLAFPVHFLDIAIDGKTFRPISLGVPLLLWAIERWESGRHRTAIVLLLLVLLAKEDYCLVIAPLAVFWSISAWRKRGSGSPPARGQLACAIGIGVGSVAWLGLVLLLVIPAFRGDVPHFAQYFGELGGTPGEILSTSIDRPGLLLQKWFAPRTVFYALALLLPLGLLPLAALGRLLVGAPIFAMLCLLEFSAGESPGQPVIPFHHFHAPLVPILYWSAAGGLGRLVDRGGAWSTRGGWFVLTSSAACGLFFSAGPLGLAFWDAHSDHHGPTLMRTSRRAELFGEVERLVPLTARVFSTDFVHPRFTHHARSYDYSDYPRHSDKELTRPVAGQDYYIVIDVQHPYSTMKSVDDVAELRQDAGSWEVLRLVTDNDGTLYYIVLRRRESP